VAKAQEIMMENIENILRRGERLEDLLDESEKAVEVAGLFNKKTETLYSNLWWKNMKLNLAIAGVVGLIALIIIFVLLIVACGGITFPGC